MRCASCHGVGYFEDYFTCSECMGSGITSCCEGNPNMYDPRNDPEAIAELKRWTEQRTKLFTNPNLADATAFFREQGMTVWKRQDVPLASVHKARLQWLDATNAMLAESIAWLEANGYETSHFGAPPLTPEQRDADRVSVGKPPLGES
jgi:hypothetical protein